MIGRRVVFITRRFWPLVGEAETALGDLAVGLHLAGWRPTIITAQWSKRWPALFAYEDVPVVRLPKPSSGWWGNWGYARRLSAWLKEQQNDVDVVVIESADPDAVAVVSALADTNTPVVLLAHEDARSLGALRKQLANIAAVVVPDDRARIAALAAGIAESDFITIAPGVSIPPPSTGDERRLARDALAKICGGGRLSPLAPLAVYAGPLDADRNLSMLIGVWKQVVERHADARLWIFGEGRRRAMLFDEIENAKLRDRVFVPGGIDCIDDLLAAADLYVAPGKEIATSNTMLAAMAAGLPIVASDTPTHRAVVTNNEHGLLFDLDEELSAESAITRLFSQPTLATVFGKNGRKRTIAKFALRERVTKFAELFASLIESNARQ